jgi:hypothetical protein
LSKPSRFFGPGCDPSLPHCAQTTNSKCCVKSLPQASGSRCREEGLGPKASSAAFPLCLSASMVILLSLSGSLPSPTR